MTKKAKILISFLAILLILILYLILTSESVKKVDDSKIQPVKSTSTILPEAEYQLKVKEVFTAYETMAQEKSFTTGKIDELRNKLLALKGLPAKFKELHLQLISALDRMEDYLNQKDQQGKNTSQQIINQLKADYSWLSN